MAATIYFIEGAEHVVTIPITGFVPLSGYEASIQFRKESGEVVMDFRTINDTLTISDQNIIMNILPPMSQGKSGKGKWQLALWTDPLLDTIKFDPCDYIIQKAPNQP